MYKMLNLKTYQTPVHDILHWNKMIKLKHVYLNITNIQDIHIIWLVDCCAILTKNILSEIKETKQQM